jgi:hypothetical protein
LHSESEVVAALMASSKEYDKLFFILRFLVTAMWWKTGS